MGYLRHIYKTLSIKIILGRKNVNFCETTKPSFYMYSIYIKVKTKTKILESCLLLFFIKGNCISINKLVFYCPEKPLKTIY